MSDTNQQYRQAWVEAIFAQAVALFHNARQQKKAKKIPLQDLARQCANTVFTENADTIVGDKELCARAFMKYCRENFPAEISSAIGLQASAKLRSREGYTEGMIN